jgi:hypothetical protein
MRGKETWKMKPTINENYQSKSASKTGTWIGLPRHWRKSRMDPINRLCLILNMAVLFGLPCHLLLSFLGGSHETED